MSVDITQLSAHLAPPLQDQVKEAYKKQAKSDTTAFLLTFFLGLVGAHRFYLNQWLSGIAHLALTIAGVIVLVEGLINSGDSRFTLIIVGVALLLIGLLWEAIDLFVIDRQVNARNLALAERLIADAELSDDTPEKSALAELDKLSRATAAPAAGGAEGTGIITPAAVAEARAMAEETAPAGAASAQFSSMSRMELSDSPVEDRREAEVRASEATVTGEPAAEAPLSNLTETEGVTQAAPGATTVDETSVLEEAAPAAALGAAAGAAGMGFIEVEHHMHEESGYRTTDSVETEKYAEPEAPVTEPLAAAPATEAPVEQPTAEAETPAASEPPEIATESTSTEPISSAEVGEPSPTMVEPAVEEQTASGPSAAEEAGVGALAGAGAAAAIEQPTQPASTLNMVAPDHTDAHPVDIESAPMADVATPGASVIRVNIPDAEQSAPEPDVAAMTESPVDSALPPVEPEPQEYVPPTVPMSDLTNAPTNDPTDVAVAPVVATEPDATAEPAAGSPSGAEIAGAAVLATLAGAGAAMAGDALLHNESNEAPAATEPAPATAPTADEAPTAPAMKRIRAVRQIVVDGKVVSEVSAEEIVPIDADSAQVEAELQERLGHLTAEQIAEMTHLSPDEIELHQQSES